jgi:large subunit ribosomal protein L25
MDHAILQARRRDVIGKAVKALRRAGTLPANLYGPNIPSQPLELDAHAFTLAERHLATGSMVDLAIEGVGSQTVAIQRIQRNPRTGLPTHVEFLAR